MAFNYEEWSATMERKHGAEWRMILRQRASMGGKAKVCKGLGRQTPERRKEIAAMGGRAKGGKHESA